MAEIETLIPDILYHCTSKKDDLTVQSLIQACGTFGIGFSENWHRKLEKSKIPYRG